MRETLLSKFTCSHRGHLLQSQRSLVHNTQEFNLEGEASWAQIARKKWREGGETQQHLWLVANADCDMTLPKQATKYLVCFYTAPKKKKKKFFLVE